MLSCQSFCFLDRTNFLACITRIKIVKKIPKRRKIIVALCTVYTIVDCDIPHIFLGKKYFCVIPDTPSSIKKCGVGEVVVLCVFEQNLLLVYNTVAVTVQAVLL